MSWEPPRYRVRAIENAIADKARRLLPQADLPAAIITELAIAAIKADHDAVMTGGPMLGKAHP